ncbi:ribosomal large subunit pseudouridine synthase B [Candidatus Phycosocius bacilliformis]|uniref:Pseudouridine synthase n=1 Tax=Candidatus Phycosocius bacilliformis TaxID=1445552 RepID=A0A2P2EAN0_9PROT|nr:ribosomal large subunit pseudouridine synthase B [Candidatus Phycosocius bacilliformis]
MTYDPTDDTRDRADSRAPRKARPQRHSKAPHLGSTSAGGRSTPPAAPTSVKSPMPKAEGQSERAGERIAKALARAGLCSRREAERWIEEGRISVNGKVLESPAFNVTAQDRILVDGKPVDGPEPTRLWRYHKPDGLVTTHKDPQGRETVFDHLPEDLPRVISVGRLDLSSEGLLLLTNDGELARALELPSTGWLRRYRVRAFGRVSQEELAKLADGITVDGISYGPMEAILDRAETANAWITVAIREGKNREVRRVLEAIGLKVNRLIRVSYGPFQLGKMPPGSVEEVAPSALKEMLGPLLPAAPDRVMARTARPPKPDLAAKPPTKPDRRGPKPPPKSAKTRVSLLEEEALIRARRQAGAGTGKPAGGRGSQSDRRRSGPNRAQTSTKPTKPAR